MSFLYAYINGKVIKKGNNYIIVETGNIGYKINTSLTTINVIGDVGAEVKIYTHLYVREDIISLYGFSTNEELQVFELLISVSGVGPKAAISVLSAVSPSKFGLSIISNDVKTLTKAQGIGPKMAQRIILELKDKIKNDQLIEQNLLDINEQIPNQESDLSSEAISALMVLGYSFNEARKAVYSLDMGPDIETIVKNALRVLGK